MSQQGVLSFDSTLTIVESLTGNSGGPVFPTAGNIDVLGNNGVGINVVGNPALSTLTIAGIQATTSQIGVTAFATNAQAAAQFASNVALTPSNITSMFSVNGLAVDQGGTGLISVPAHDLLVGNGTSPLNLITPSGTSGIPLISQGLSADAIFGTALVPGGGTGAVSFLAHSLLLGQGTSAITALGPATNGQIPIGSVGVDPVFATLTPGAGIAITNGAGSITIASTGAGFAWSDTSGAFAATAENGYFITATATGTLPASPNEGDTISFIVDTTQFLTIQANTGQKIRLGTTISAAAGTCVNNFRGDAIELVYRSTGTTWFATTSIGTWTIT